MSNGHQDTDFFPEPAQMCFLFLWKEKGWFVDYAPQSTVLLPVLKNQFLLGHGLSRYGHGQWFSYCYTGLLAQQSLLRLCSWNASETWSYCTVVRQFPPRIQRLHCYVSLLILKMLGKLPL